LNARLEHYRFGKIHLVGDGSPFVEFHSPLDIEASLCSICQQRKKKKWNEMKWNWERTMKTMRKESSLYVMSSSGRQYKGGKVEKGMKERCTPEKNSKQVGFLVVRICCSFCGIFQSWRRTFIVVVWVFECWHTTHARKSFSTNWNNLKLHREALK
jgi:hypothetical protein